MLGLLLAAGCGGSAQEERGQALERWVARADAACQRANGAIAERGWPVDLVDLDRLTVRAVADVRSGIRAISELPRPEGAEQRVRPFVEELRGLEPLLDELSSATEAMEPDPLRDIAPKLQAQLAALEEQSEKLGMVHCAANDERFFIPDAVRAPVFAQELARVNRRIGKRIDELGAPPRGASLDTVARTMDELSEILATAVAALDGLEPPQWAAPQAARYLNSLRDMGSVMDAAAGELAAPGLTPADLASLQRKYARAGREERKRYRQLIRAIGARPALPEGDPASPTEPSEEAA